MELSLLVDDQLQDLQRPACMGERLTTVLTGSGTARRMQADAAIARLVVVVNCGRRYRC